MSDVQTRIADDVKSNDVLLYMKGTPVFPQCGFSAMTVQILNTLGVKFKAVDVLSDPEVRNGIKEFSNWPTIPQLYVKGEFVGGADILREMYESQELGPKAREMALVLEASKSGERDTPDFLEVQEAKSVKLLRTPKLADVPYAVQMEPHLIVEFYSR